MIAPRLVWMPPDFDVAYVSKSDYDELKAKLTATQSELAKIYATEPVAVYEGVEFSRYTLRWVNGDLAVGTNFYAAPIPPTEVEPATEYAEYILDHYDRKSRKDRKLLGKHLAEWADRRYRDAAPIPPTVTPSQQKVLSAVDTLLATFDSGYHPELNLIRDFMLARPDAPIPTTGETK